MKPLHLIFAGAAGIAVGFAGWYSGRTGGGDIFAACKPGATGAQIGGPFTLVSETGETVTDAEVLARPSLVYFGFTFCPDVCPVDTVRNAEAVDLLAGKGYEVQPVFITVDPERDTPEVLAEYTGYIHPDMLGLTGTVEQVKDAAGAYRAYFAKQDTGDDYYLVDHTTFTYLMLPEHGFVDYFRRDTSAGDMADKVACFLDAAG